jgi:hypothetical protein
MRSNKRIGRILITCSTIFLLTTPVLAASGNGGNDPGNTTPLISSGSDLLLAGNGNGPGDGTGNDGDGPQDGTGNGPGDCTTAVHPFDSTLLLARGGNGNGGGNGGHGPGDGTGNGGSGPGDGTGNGPGSGTCQNS